jgi:choline dehydrogenase-like flavoprotein
MRQYGEDEAVDFAVVGTGAGGGPLICGLAEGGFSVVGFDAGPYFRPLEDFASDEREQDKLYWTDERVVDGANPITMGGKNSGKAVGGSTVHFAALPTRMVQVAQRPGLRRRLAAQLAGDVAILHQGREGAQHFGAVELSLGT